MDVSNSAQLLVFISFGWKLNEDMLFCTPLEGTCTSEEIFIKLYDKLQDGGRSWDKYVSVCTDGAGAMLGRKEGLKARVLQVAPLFSTHCNELGSEHEGLLFQVRECAQLPVWAAGRNAPISDGGRVSARWPPHWAWLVNKASVFVLYIWKTERT